MSLRSQNGYVMAGILVASLVASVFLSQMGKIMDMQMTAGRGVETQTEFRTLANSIETILAREDLCSVALKTSKLTPARFSPLWPAMVANDLLHTIQVGTQKYVSMNQVFSGFKITELSLTEVPGAPRIIDLTSATFVATLRIKGIKTKKAFGGSALNRDFTLSVTTETVDLPTVHQIKKCQLKETRSISSTTSAGFNKFAKGNFIENRDVPGTRRVSPYEFDGPFEQTVNVPFKPSAAYLTPGAYAHQIGFKQCVPLNNLTVYGETTVTFKYIYAHEDSPSCPGCTNTTCFFDYFVLGSTE